MELPKWHERPENSKKKISEQETLDGKSFLKMADHFIKKVPTSTPDNMKLMMKMKFLGLENIKIGKTIIHNQVKHSSTLDKGEMVHFLDQVYHWARDNGVLLTVPSDSEYQKLKNQQVM